jgi:hypothetical protein
MGKPAKERRLRARAGQRELIREYRLACAAAGWIRRHPRVPHTGCFLVIDNLNWMMTESATRPTPGPARRLPP